MKNSLSVSLWLVLILFAATDVSFAQLINYNRRNSDGSTPAPRTSGYGQKKQKASAPAESTPTSTPAPVAATNNDSDTSMNTPTPEAQPIQQARADFQVKSRVEELYDVNHDGNLQKDEVNTFLKDVISAVDRRGTFSVSSDILREYDKNKDGVISKTESKEIPTVN